MRTLKIVLKSTFMVVALGSLLQIFSCEEENPAPTNTSSTSGSTSGGTTGGSGSGNNTPPTKTAPSTLFLSDECRSLTGLGAWRTQEFTLSGPRKFVFRVSTRFAADAAIITASQLEDFKNNRSFSGFGLFDNTFGYKTVDLSAGTYYLAVRNQIAGANVVSTELDYDITLPSSDKATFVDVYINAVKTVDAGARMWHEFTIQSGYRYFIDGNNTGLASYVVAAAEIEKFKGGQTFQYYTDYSGDSCNEPGLYEISLPPGTYYLCFRNTSNLSNAVNYFMERWRITQ